MILLWVASLLIALACGTLPVLTLVPSLGASRAGWAFALFLGAGLGLGLLSCLHFLALLANAVRWLPLLDLAAGALLGGVFLHVRRRRSGPQDGLEKPARQPWSRWQLALAGIVSLQALAAAVSFLVAFFKEPHGRWDAWLIWNMHARFLFRAGDRWPEAFSSGMDWSHWDYPLLLPLAIARGWIYQGAESLAAPVLTAFLFTLLTVGVLAAGLTLLRGHSEGRLAAMVLLGTPFFLFMGAAQFADVPLAFFFLAALTLLAAQARSAGERTGMLILAGLAAGLAAWTKNEGLLFVLAAAAALCGATLRSSGGRAALSRTLIFGAGALPVLLIVLYFKATLAPANDLIADAGAAAVLEKLLDPGRYGEIARAFALTGLSFTQGIIDIREGMRLNPGPVSILLPAAYVLLTGLNIPQGGRDGLTAAAATLGLMLAGYFMVYVITSQDLTWHLATSLNRLFLQLWPATLLLCFLVAGARAAPAPVAAAGTAPPSSPPKGKRPKRNPEVK